MSNDARIIRDRQAAQERALDVAVGRGHDGAAAILCQTTTVMTYPTSAQAYYAVNPGQAGNVETEGGVASLTADTSTTLYAYNTGTQTPPNGTWLIVHAVGGRLVFRYDG